MFTKSKIRNYIVIFIHRFDLVVLKTNFNSKGIISLHIK